MAFYIRLFVLAVGALWLSTGCYHLEESITVNPDGSAKIKVTIIGDPERLIEGAPADPPEDFSEEDFREQFREQLFGSFESIKNESVGVDTVTPYEEEELADGRMQMSTTLYVPDLSKYRLAGTDSNDMPFPMFVYDFKRSESGKTTLEVKVKDLTDWEPSKEGAPDLTEEELVAVKAKLADIGRSYADGAEELEASKARNEANLVELYRISTVIKVAGEIQEHPNLTKVSEKEAQINLSGEKWMKMLGVLFQDEALVQQMIQNGYEPGKVSLPAPVVNEHLFGEPQRAMLTMDEAEAPLFDYKKEMEEAKLALAVWESEWALVPDNEVEEEARDQEVGDELVE